MLPFQREDLLGLNYKRIESYGGVPGFPSEIACTHDIPAVNTTPQIAYPGNLDSEHGV